MRKGKVRIAAFRLSPFYFPLLIASLLSLRAEFKQPEIPAELAVGAKNLWSAQTLLTQKLYFRKLSSRRWNPNFPKSLRQRIRHDAVRVMRYVNRHDYFECLQSIAPAGYAFSAFVQAGDGF